LGNQSWQATCVIGGTALVGGRGSIIGPFLGIIIVVAVIVNKFTVKQEEWP